MTKITRKQFLKRGILAALLLALLDAFWFERYLIQWNTFDISDLSKPKIKVMQLSDLHFDQLRSFHVSIAQKINEEKPDLLMITGDALDHTDKIPAFHDFLKLLDVAIPKFAITGNWEYWGKVDLEQLKAVYQEQNCQLLINENQTINLKNRSIAIVGIDDFVGGNADYKHAISGLKEEIDTTIVLTHCPQHRDVIIQQKGEEKIDLVLCGHTHGGQITILGYAPITPRGSGRYVKGWYKDNNLPTYVSKGIGTSIWPIRFGARAEMVTFEV